MKLVLASTSKIKNEILNKVGMKHSNLKRTFRKYQIIKRMFMNT